MLCLTRYPTDHEQSWLSGQLFFCRACLLFKEMMCRHGQSQPGNETSCPLGLLSNSMYISTTLALDEGISKNIFQVIRNLIHVRLACDVAGKSTLEDVWTVSCWPPGGPVTVSLRRSRACNSLMLIVLSQQGSVATGLCGQLCY